MREYETTFIVQPEISDEGVESLTQRLDGILEEHGSTRLMYDDQGRRRLAYEIQNFQKGRYIALLYLDDGAVVVDLERMLRLDDSILRFLTVQVSSEVKDVESRKAEAAEVERIRAEKAAERAQREAEEAERTAQQAAERAVAEERAAAEAAKAVSGEEADAQEPSGENSPATESDAAAEASGDKAAAAVDDTAAAESDDKATAEVDDKAAAGSDVEAASKIDDKAASEAREA